MSNTVQPFAVTKLSPWAIAWLVKTDDWSHLERVIHHNCIILGGYYNVLIPVSNDGKIWPSFETFLFLYDPDYVILAPGMSKLDLENPLAAPNPYGVITWDQASQIIPADAMGSSNFHAARISPVNTFERQADSLVSNLVAVSDDAYPDVSGLALLACGDVLPTEPEWEPFDGGVSLHVSGYREMILRQFAREDRTHHVGARLGPEDHVIPAPNRTELAFIIRDENKFPLTGAADILKACCAIQHWSRERRTFIGRSVPYHGGGGTPVRNFSHIVGIPGMAILVSDHFGFQEAVLFWNLRANGVLASWLAFSQMEEEMPAIREWLISDYGGVLFTSGADIAFASSATDQIRLSRLFSTLTENGKSHHWQWKLSNYEAMTLYDFERPHLQRNHVPIIQESDDCSFLPEYPEKTFGTLGLTIECPSLMSPRSQTNAALISGEKKLTVSSAFGSTDNGQPRSDLLRFRITNARYPRLQINDDSPVRFRVPSLENILTAMLQEKGYRLREGQHSQYQQTFIKRAGSLDHACRFLGSSRYREFFSLMSNGKDQNLSGWLLKDPPKRRALHQATLYSAFGKNLPGKTNDYFNTGESLPEEAVALIDLQLLERGFQLLCRSCSAKSWYPAEEVGQSFRCRRCYSDQKVRSHPLWLYKLPEVVFQLFCNNADVPLLALHYLQEASRKSFQYGLDSDIAIANDGKEKNIDFSCLLNGRVFIGEAKSNDEIGAEQFGFYEKLISQTGVDGVVFATSETDWSPSTRSRSENLKSNFAGEVMVLTKVSRWRA